LPLGLTTVLGENNHLRPSKASAHYRVLAPKPDLTRLHCHPYLLVDVDQRLFSSLTRHHHGHLYQTSTHRYLLTNNDILRNAPQSISNTLDGSIHNRRDSDLERRLRKSARLLTTYPVTSHLQPFTGRSHHICHQHHMPNINV